MRNNIDKVNARGEQLDDLGEKAGIVCMCVCKYVCVGVSTWKLVFMTT